ncbi:iron complex transport system substrate-binding protein [Krasilnikovia cinnamomea]|uniref:Iron complex transport system substrate-binding protein n=1 Tax=Krasilnikovia cinnamomea TaxID=349313 RepID=A0A4Q7ZTY4_9ACTN|nr:iron-siderophore ABC transporter substrate-binding protein [Krasilnikovia cinnamomea]RZU54019.1 iron complex transport system substrate-binding protein [Krasilnikovia cinnamomea]
MSHSLRVRLGAAVTALAAGLALAACGTDAKPTTGASAPAGAAFPVQLTHKYGSTEIKAAPQRVVTLGLSDADAVLALGVKPVGVVDWFEEKPYGKWPWAQPAWGGTAPAIVGLRDEYNLEKVAAAKPDVIIAQYSGMKKEQYDTLSKIAPVVAQPVGFADYQAPWRDMSRVIGKALGQPAKMDQLIADVDAKFAAARTAHPGWAGKTVAIAEIYEAGKFSAFNPNDPKMIFMKELGFTASPAYTQAVGSQNVADIGYERFDVLESDRLIWFVTGDDTRKQLAANKPYQQLKVASENRHLFLDYENPPVAAAMSFNTVLSIPYALDQIQPQLGQ